MKMTRSTFLARTASVDDENGELRLRFTRTVDGTHETLTVEVPAGEVQALMVAIATHGGSALRFVAEAWQRGECPTCSNVRMVPVTMPGGWTSSEHCPACRPAGSVFDGYPVVRPADGP